MGNFFRYECCGVHSGVHSVNHCDLLVRYTIPLVPVIRPVPGMMKVPTKAIQYTIIFPAFGYNDYHFIKIVINVSLCIFIAEMEEDRSVRVRDRLRRTILQRKQTALHGQGPTKTTLIQSQVTQSSVQYRAAVLPSSQDAPPAAELPMVDVTVQQHVATYPLQSSVLMAGAVAESVTSSEHSCDRLVFCGLLIKLSYYDYPCIEYILDKAFFET